MSTRLCSDKWLIFYLDADIISAVVVLMKVHDLILIGELVILKVDVEGNALDPVAEVAAIICHD